MTIVLRDFAPPFKKLLMKDYVNEDNSRQLILLAVILALIFFGWGSKLIYPFQMLTVFFHEASHAIAAILTGGEVLEFGLDPRQGGHVLSRGGSPFWLATSGYIGSCIWGSLIYLCAARTEWDRWLLGSLGILIVLLAVYFGARDFALYFSLLTGGAIVLMAKFAPKGVDDFLLRVIGLTSMVYAPLDIYSDVLDRTHVVSDAVILSREVGGPAVVWGVLWILVSLAVVLLTLKFSLKKTRPPKPVKPIK